MGAREIIFEKVVPAVGVVLFLVMSASPTRTVWRTRKRSDIGGERGRVSKAQRALPRQRCTQRDWRRRRHFPRLGFQSTTVTPWQCSTHPLIEEFNPLPSAVLVGNTVSWNAYALVTHDPFITVSSSGG